MRNFIGGIACFAYFFRPQIFSPLLSTSLFPAFMGLFFLLLRPRYISILISRLGLPVVALVVFLVLWSGVIDLLSGGFVSAGARSFLVSNVRFLVVTVVGAVFIVLNLSESKVLLFLRFVKYAISIQLALAFLMFLSLDFKNFMYSGVSGYTGAEKLFKPHFFDSRIFGWSEELFYLAPVFMIFSVFISVGKLRISSLIYMALVVVVALMNARVAIIGLLFGTLLRFGARGGVVITLFLCFIVLSLIWLSVDNSTVAWLISDITSGRSRTLEILLRGHIVWLIDDFFGFIFGEWVYLHAGYRDHTSDIGWLILFNYGGLIYLFAWVALVWNLSLRAFGLNMYAILVFFMISLLAVKGLVFSSNSMLGFLICLCLTSEKGIGLLNISKGECEQYSV